MTALQQVLPAASHALLEVVLADGYVRVPDVRAPTLEFARSIGEVFHARLDEDPVVSMKIEGNDALVTPYASCRTAELSLHTDYATFPDPPRFTITHCVDPDPEFPDMGKSVIVRIDKVLAHLREQEREVDHLLRNCCFPFRRNVEHDSYHDDGVPEFPILEGDLVRFDSTLVLPALEQSRSPNRERMIYAVRRFEEICHGLGRRTEFALNRREALITDNRRVVHSRGPCTVRNDGSVLVSREVNLVFLV